MTYKNNILPHNVSLLESPYYLKGIATLMWGCIGKNVTYRMQQTMHLKNPKLFYETGLLTWHTHILYCLSDNCQLLVVEEYKFYGVKKPGVTVGITRHHAKLSV